MAFKIPARFSRRALRPYLSEFLGTALLILIGDGVVAQAVLTDFYYANYLSVNLAWAGAVALSCYLAGGAAVNPAITIASALVRPTKQAWRELPGKVLAQTLGGFVGAAIVYAEYRSAIAAWDPELTIPGGSILSPQGHHSAGIFSTYPAAHFTNNFEPAITEFLGAAVLMFGALAVSDPKNAKIGAPQFTMFALMLSIGAALGWQTGYAVNPARDFGPRLFSAIIYGREVFSTKGFYSLIPIFVPIIGCIAGAVTYDAFLFEGEGSAVADALDRVEEEDDGQLRLD